MLAALAHRLKRRLTFANTIAVLALFVALGGTSLGRPVRSAGASAASSVKKALGLSQKANRNSRNALKLARRADKNAKAALARAGIPGPAGSPGSPGSPGAPGLTGKPGSALAYAAIEYCASGNCPDQDTVDWFTPDDQALGIDNEANFKHAADGVFCFQNLLAEVHNVTVTPSPSPNAYLLQARAGTITQPIGSPCTPSGPADHNAVVEVRNPVDPFAHKDPAQGDRLYVLFN